MISQILLLILLNKPNINTDFALELSTVIVKYSKQYSVPAKQIASIAFIESSYRVKANRKNLDYGLMQINIKAHPTLDKEKLLTLDYNIKHGVRIYSEFYRYYKKNVRRAVSSYNCGYRKGCYKWKSVVRYFNRFNKTLNRRCK